MTTTATLPRIYLSHMPELDWLSGVEFGRVDDGQPSECWVGLSENVGLLLDEPGGVPVGFKVIDYSSFDEKTETADEVWNGARFHAPQVGLEDASIGEIVIAAKAFFAGEESVNRVFFGRGTSSEGEKALFHWRCCLEAGDSMAHFALGYTLYELGRYHEAYRHLRYYAHIAPAGSWNWCWLGKACEAIGEPGEARAAYERACELEVVGGEETDAAELLVQMDLREEKAGERPPSPEEPDGDGDETELRFFKHYRRPAQDE
jgi:tetratricopeptide (TPR) repeat protein